VEFRSGQYLTLRVGGQDFAIEAGCVRGILPTHELVSAEQGGVPGGNGWRAGSATLRGQALPVVDLRAKLGLRLGVQGRNPSIVVVEARGSLVGFLADGVCEVIYARAHEYRAGKIRVGRPREILDPNSLALEPATL
jgi:purine-binding chemotaxis protein CheW